MSDQGNDSTMTSHSSSLLASSSSYDTSKIKVKEVLIARAGRQQSQSQLPLGIRILKGKSLVSISNLLSRQEIDYLVQASLEAATDQDPGSSVSSSSSEQQQQQGGGGGGGGGPGDRVCVRMPTLAAAQRQDIPDTDNLHNPLSNEISKFVEHNIIERTLAFIDQELCPSIKETLFGNHQLGGPTTTSSNSSNADDDVSILKLFQENKLVWSTREPAINVYYAPSGYFGIHKDNKALTILMPLTSPHEDFTGGGTAFWSETHPVERMHSPSKIMTPPAGTALLFGGKVSHKGLHIETGKRVVFVASFSRLLPKKKSKTWTVSAR